MKSILELLYDGEINLTEIRYPRNETHRAIVAAYRKKFVPFRSSLPPALVNAFDDMMDACIDVSAEDCKFNFIDGFRLGALAMIEVFTGENGFMPPEK